MEIGVSLVWTRYNMMQIYPARGQVSLSWSYMHFVHRVYSPLDKVFLCIYTCCYQVIIYNINHNCDVDFKFLIN